MNTELRDAILGTAGNLGIDAVDLATVMSYETAGTFNPWKKGPVTQYGRHRGLIQWGGPQRAKYGVYKNMPVADQVKAAGEYLKDAGVKPGMGLLDVYSAINAGRVGRYNASDANNGGAPGTVRDKVEKQMGGHRRKALALMGATATAPTFDPTAFGAVPLDAPTAPVDTASTAAPPTTQAAFAGDTPVAPAVGALDTLVQPVSAKKPIYQVDEPNTPVPFDPVAAGAVPFQPENAGAVPILGTTPTMVVPDVMDQEGFGTLTGTTPSVGERVGNFLYQTAKSAGLPASQMRKDLQTLDSYIRGAADAGTFGAADEISAGLGAATGVGGEVGDYSGNLQGQRNENKQRSERDPIATGVGELSGGVANAMVLAPAAAANTLGRIGQGIKLGAGYGGAYGFGSGEGGVEARTKNAFVGAITGGVIGGAIPAAGAVVGKGYSTLADVMVRPAANAIRSVVNPEANALRLAQKALARDNITPEQAGVKMSSAIAAGDDTHTLMDVAGDNTRRLGRFAANMPGEGADKLKATVFDRQLAQPERITEAVRKGLDDPERYFSTVDDIIAQRQTAAKPLYDKAYETPVPFTAKLESLLGRGKVMQKALAGARDMAEAEGIPSKQFFAKIADDGSYTIQGVPDARQWDYMKRSLDDIISSETETLPNGAEKLSNMGRVVAGIRREMLSEIDKHNPSYAQARKVYSSASESLDAVTKGGKLLDADPELAKRTIADMSEGDKQLARLGVSKALVDRVQRMKDGANTVRAIFASPKHRAVLKEIFPGEKSFNDFKTTMEREAEKTRTKNAIGGNSTTAAQMSDIADNAVDLGVVGHLATGRFAAAAGSIVQKALSRATVVNEATAKEIANILTTSDPQVAQQIMGQMQKMAMKDQRVAKNLVRIRGLLRNSAIVGGTKETTDSLAR